MKTVAVILLHCFNITDFASHQINVIWSKYSKRKINESHKKYFMKNTNTILFIINTQTYRHTENIHIFMCAHSKFISFFIPQKTNTIKNILSPFLTNSNNRQNFIPKTITSENIKQPQNYFNNNETYQIPFL